MKRRTALLGLALAGLGNGYALAQASTTPAAAPPAAAAPAPAPAAAPTPAPAPGQYCVDAEHRQFDFWLGDWDVSNPDGKQIGTNQVTSVMGSCVLQEHWQGLKGPAGTSFNTYSKQDQKWYQMWVTDRGGFFQLVGGLQGGKMVMTREVKNEGKTVLQRWSWEKVSEDRVVQRSEISEDGGKTWQAGFQGIYNRRKP
jgi:hypothetical protein